MELFGKAPKTSGPDDAKAASILKMRSYFARVVSVDERSASPVATILLGLKELKKTETPSVTLSTIEDAVKEYLAVVPPHNVDTVQPMMSELNAAFKP